jgi:uncharacterized protein YggU (UPF0235/DUF167 family)
MEHTGPATVAGRSSQAIVRVAVIAHPGARQDRVELLEDGSLAVWVRARPIDGEANAAIERTLARALGLRSRQVVVVAGTATRSHSFRGCRTVTAKPTT